MKKEDKSLLITSLVEKLNEYAHFYVVDLTGLDSETTSKLRAASFKSEIKLVMVKNTLFKKALLKKGEEVGIDFAPICGTDDRGVLKGTTAVMFCNTANAPAKLIKEFAKDNKDMPALKGAFAEECFYGPSQLEELIHIKSKNELIAEVVSLLESPMQNVLGCLNSAANTIHGVLDTLAEKGE